MTETKKSTKIAIGAVAIVAVIALILGIVALVNHGDTKANAIPTINQQVDNIKNTLPELEALDKELGGYIDTLETTVETLQKDLVTTNTAIDTLETEVYSKVDAEKTATLNQLKSDKTELEGKIAATNKALEEAKAANTASEKAISDTITALEAELEKADADNKKALEDSIAALEEALTTADANNKKALEDSIAALKTAMETADGNLTTAIQNLNTTLSALIKTNADDIDALEATAADLQTQLNTTNTKIDNIKTELETKISDSEKKVLGELNTLKEDIEVKLTTVNNEITALKAKDTELDGKITDLREYVDTQDAAIEDWAEETFSTLTQYQETQKAISGINALIETINTDIADIKEDVAKQVETINKSISDLDAELASEVEKVTSGYQKAVEDAEKTITTAYTKAIENAIDTSEAEMQKWVGETLTSGYYTSATVQGMIDALTTQLTEGDEALQGEIDKLKTDLADAEATLTEAYKMAISDAITKNNGKITEEIAAAVNVAQNALQAQIDAINKDIEDIESRLTALEAQIQSVTFVPLYTDGAVKMAKDASGNAYAFFDFRVSPKAAAEALTVDDLLMEAIYVTDAAQRGDNKGTVTTISLPVLEVSGNKETGIVTIKVSGANLSEDFYNGKVSASAVLTIKTGATEIVSDYVPMVAHSQVWTNIVSVQDWITATLQGGEAEEQIN